MSRLFRRVGGPILGLLLVGSILVAQAAVFVSAADQPDPPTSSRSPSPTPTQAQMGVPHTASPHDGEQASAAEASVYVPLLIFGFPGAERGIHLGNLPEQFWSKPSDFLTDLRGTAERGVPKVIVVLSDQLYNVNRSAPGCRIDSVSVRHEPDFAFVQQVTAQGAHLIIRIHPSPGNFRASIYGREGEDWRENIEERVLYTDSRTPENRDYCAENDTLFRAIDDIADEITAIYQLNLSRGIPASAFSFVPANEPNNEWYNLNTNPAVDRIGAWQDMAAYFSALYDEVRGRADVNNLQLLTPPMAQGNFAEAWNFDCNPFILRNSRGVVVAGVGYDYMERYYRQENDGYTWNNYWNAGKESWYIGSGCSVSSNHIVQFFPSWLVWEIRGSGKPAYITEADLLSPCQGQKVPFADKDANPAATASSIRRFINNEWIAEGVAVWLLIEAPPSEIEDCPGGEVQWHSAYRPNGTRRAWFVEWWRP